MFPETAECEYGDKYYIVPQVHLLAIFEHRIKGQNYRGARKKTFSKEEIEKLIEFFEEAGRG